MSTTFVIRLPKQLSKYTDRLPTQYNELNEINDNDQVVARVFNWSLTLYWCAGLLPDNTPILAIDNEDDCKTIWELKKHFIFNRKEWEFLPWDIVEFKQPDDLYQYEIISIGEDRIVKLCNARRSDYIRYTYISNLKLIRTWKMQ